MDWRRFVKGVEQVSVPKLRSSRLGYAVRKTGLRGSSTLLAYRGR